MCPVPPDHSRAAVPVAPSLDPALQQVDMPRRFRPLDLEVLRITVLALGLGLVAALVARALTALIGLVGNAVFHQRFGIELVEPTGHALGAWVIVVPALGGLVVGAMARWGSQAIRGHGIPEAMEQVLLNESRIPPRVAWLKPLSSAVAIGTGGPFGAEGPIIATGGALGSLLGQLLHVTADQRKTLLAAGAAAGMAAVFDTPVSAVLLAVELLLFERRARSLIPVALAATAAAALRHVIEGHGPVFPMAPAAAPGGVALLAYVALGAVAGIASVGVTRLTYAIEDGFARLPVHWMWWPALGGLVVGLIGYLMPATLGVGYGNIEALLDHRLALAAVLALGLLKLLSWSVALGSGTSGGTLAPLLTIGGALGSVFGLLLAGWPALGVDPGIAALVGMAAMFAGASRAFLASVVFAFETTQQANGLLPLLGGCATAYLLSGLLMRHTIMTEKIARRGVHVPSDYSVDYLERILVRDACSRALVSLAPGRLLSDVRGWLHGDDPRAQHQGFPVIADDGRLLGVLTRRQLLSVHHDGNAPVASLITRAPIVVTEQHSLRDAADRMVAEDVGRLVVVADGDPRLATGFLTRSDLLAAHARRLREAHQTSRAWSDRTASGRADGR